VNLKISKQIFVSALAAMYQNIDNFLAPNI
jgi:hypothetical protein